MEKALERLIQASKMYGNNTDMVLVGGGNTSVKDEEVMYVKASGHALGSIDVTGFVKMDMKAMRAIWKKTYSADTEQREEEVLADMMAARCEGETARPSVEALLHSLLKDPFVIHMHPGLVNGVTCSQTGEQTIKRLFGDRSVWIPLVNPGYILAKVVKDAIEKHEADTGVYPDMIFLQNHGVFVSGETLERVNAVYEEIMDRLGKELKRTPDLTAVEIAAERSGIITEAMGIEPSSLNNKELMDFLADEKTFYPVSSSFTPDHIVYSGFKPLWIAEDVFSAEDPAAAVKEAIAAFTEEHGSPAKVLAVQNTGVFAVNKNARDLFLDTVKVAVFTESFGGPRFMDDDQIDFIRNWEVEKYRAKMSST